MLVAGIVLLPLLGRKPLAHWDEGIYAEISRAMLGHSWLVPTWQNHVWLEKPPLMLWITAIFFKFFQVSEFWARIGSALSGIALVGASHWWLAKRGGMRAAWFSSLILISTLGFIRACRVGEMDVLLSLGCFLAISGLTVVGCGKPNAWYLFWTGFGLAAITKGGASVVIPLTLAIVAISGRWPRANFRHSFIGGLLLFLAIVLPWHFYMFHLFGSSFIHTYFGWQIFARASAQIEGHNTHFCYYAWDLSVSAVPWVFLFPFALISAFKKPEFRAWAIFALTVLVFFTLVQTRLPHYIVPVYAPFAILTGDMLADLLDRPAFRLKSKPAWALLGLATSSIWIITVKLTETSRVTLHAGTAAIRGDPTFSALPRAPAPDLTPHAQPKK